MENSTEEKQADIAPPFEVYKPRRWIRAHHRDKKGWLLVSGIEYSTQCPELMCLFFDGEDHEVKLQNFIKAERAVGIEAPVRKS